MLYLNIPNLKILFKKTTKFPLKTDVLFYYEVILTCLNPILLRGAWILAYSANIIFCKSHISVIEYVMLC